MKLSAQEEYGLRCLLQLARRGERESLTIPQIGQAEGLSVPNVAKLMRQLRLAGYVHSARGQAGGYKLARPARQIIVGDVLDSLGGQVFGPGFCDRHAGKESICTHSSDCSIRSLWRAMQESLTGILSKTTLQDLVSTEPEMDRCLASLPGATLRDSKMPDRA